MNLEYLSTKFIYEILEICISFHNLIKNYDINLLSYCKEIYYINLLNFSMII